MRKIISLVVITAIIFATTAGAFALTDCTKSVNSYVNTEINITELVISDSEDEKLVVEGIDYENGDSCFYLVRNGDILSQSYVHRDTDTITYENYETGFSCSETIIIQGRPSSRRVLASSSDYTFARIVAMKMYKTIQGETISVGPSDLKTEYKDFVAREKYDIKGSYKDSANLVAKIALVFAVPTGIAGKAALFILSNLDIAPNAINFIIGSEEVTATRTDVTWHVEGFSDLDIITGTKHAFTVNGKSQVDYEGDYYPITSMRDKNEKLAIKLAKKTLKGFDRYEVHIWK